MVLNYQAKCLQGGCSGNVHETNLNPLGRLPEKF